MESQPGFAFIMNFHLLSLFFPLALQNICKISETERDLDRRQVEVEKVNGVNLREI